MTKQQTKDIRFFVEIANSLLRTPEVQNNLDKRLAIRLLVEQVLLNKHMYHGFNYFEPVKSKKTKFSNALCELKLAGKETNLIQYYTSKGGTI